MKKMMEIMAVLTFLLLAIACKTGELKNTEMTHTEVEQGNINEHKEGERYVQFGMRVASKQIDCMGMVPQKCLLVKEGGDEVWQQLYNEIEGFDYEEGYEYHLEVRKYELENVPADASVYKYVLVNEISKTKKDSDIRKEAEKSSFEGTWNLKELDGNDVAKHQATASFEGEGMNLFSGCNTSFGYFFMTDNEKIFAVSTDKVGATMKGCADDSIETQYFELIKKIDAFEASKNELKFFAGDKLLMVFVR